MKMTETKLEKLDTVLIPTMAQAEIVTVGMIRVRADGLVRVFDDNLVYQYEVWLARHQFAGLPFETVLYNAQKARDASGRRR